MSNAIKQFQRTKNLVEDGVAGSSTIYMLKSHADIYNAQMNNSIKEHKINLGDRVLKKGMEGTDVTQLKNILIDKGCISGNLVKGSILFDAEIEKAVIEFQRKTGIDADGIVEFQTVYFLKK